MHGRRDEGLETVGHGLSDIFGISNGRCEDTYAEVARDLLTGPGGGASQGSAVGDQIGRRLKELRVGDAMVTDVDAVGPETPVTELARKMLDKRHRRVIVKGDDDAVLGIVTSSDLVRLIAEGRLADG